MSEPIGAIEQAASGGTYVAPRLDRVLLSERATARVTQVSPRAREIMHLMAEGMTGRRSAIGSASPPRRCARTCAT